VLQCLRVLQALQSIPAAPAAAAIQIGIVEDAQWIPEFFSLIAEVQRMLK
jgi:hypothetical protein